MAAGAAVTLATATVAAQTWHLTPSLGGELTYTDNVGLGSPKQSDVVLQITPALVVLERGAHTSLSGSIQLPVLLYARSTASDEVRPEVNLSGTAELYPRLFFVDASVQVSNQFVSPFAPQPQSLVNATNNRYTAQSYSVSPYLRGETSDLKYELRDTNGWSNASNLNLATTGGRAYTNDLIGKLSRDPRPLGWGVDYDRLETRFSDQDRPFITELGRLRGEWQPDPQWQLSASGGYEDNRYPLTEFSGAIYGAGFKWRPTERTNLDASWEHRFFGASYHVNFEERTPLTKWSLVALRDITSYPQQIANLPGQTDVSAALNTLFASRIADPAARQTFVDQLIRDRGLPTTLTGPVNLFTQQITLQESVQGTVTLLGVRNTVVVVAYRTRSEPVASADLPSGDLIATSNVDNTQTGTSVVWSYRLTPLYTLATTGTWSRTVANDESGEQSKQGTLQVVLSAPLSTLTSAFAGLRYQRFTSNRQSDIEESAVFVGITHTFR